MSLPAPAPVTDRPPEPVFEAARALARLLARRQFEAQQTRPPLPAGRDAA